MQNYYHGNTLAIVCWLSPSRRNAAFLLKPKERYKLKYQLFPPDMQNVFLIMLHRNEEKISQCPQIQAAINQVCFGQAYAVGKVTG